jgi:hypothetical protein
MTGGQTVDDAELVVACTLDKTGLEKQSRRWRELRGRAEVRQLMTPEGKRLYFRADEGVLREVTDLTAVENNCCSWAQWTVEPLTNEVVLHVTSTAHGVEVIHQMFDDSAGRTRPPCCNDCA